MKKYNVLLIIAGGIIFFALLLNSILNVAFDKNAYKSEYSKLGTAAGLGMPENDLEALTDVLIDYMKGERPTLGFQVTVNGELREAFNDREKAHMVDVQRLFSTAIFTRGTLVILALLLISIVLIIKHQQLVDIAKQLLKGIGAGLVFLALMAMFISLDFAKFWVLFHKLAFSNDLWLLNPATDLMINMFPGEFFYAICIRIILNLVISLGVICVVLAAVVFLGKREKRKIQCI